MGIKNMKTNITFFALIIIISTTLQQNCSDNKFTGPIPKETITKILKQTNSLRANLANGKVTSKNNALLPPSTNMNKIYWNEELAEKSQKWVNELVKKCTFSHNPNRYIGMKGIPVGENIGKLITDFKKIPSKRNINNAFRWANNKWWDERLIFDINEWESEYKFEEKYGHFTQMGWAETSQIGCGYALFSDDKFKTTNEIVVCNYAVEGNDIGRGINIKGKPCSKCGHKLPCSKEYPGLCGFDDKIFEKEVAFHDENNHKGDPLFLNYRN